MAESPEQKAAKAAAAKAEQIAEAKKVAAAAMNDGDEEGADEATHEEEVEEPKEEAKGEAKTPKEEAPREAKEEAFVPRKGEEHIYVVEIVRGPKFNSNTGEKIAASFYKQKFTKPEFTLFAKESASLGLKYTVLYAPKEDK